MYLLICSTPVFKCSGFGIVGLSSWDKQTYALLCVCTDLFVEVSCQNTVSCSYIGHLSVWSCDSFVRALNCLHSFFIFSHILVDFLQNLHAVKFTLCGVQFCRFLQIHHIMYPPARYHTNIGIMPTFLWAAPLDNPALIPSPMGNR